MRTVRMVVADPERGPRIERVECSLQSLRDLIGGGWLEGHRIPVLGSIAVYCDDEGLLKGLRPSVVDLAGYVIFRGPVLFFQPDGEGEEEDIPEDMAEAIVASARMARDEDGQRIKVIALDLPLLPTGRVSLEGCE